MYKYRFELLDGTFILRTREHWAEDDGEAIEYATQWIEETKDQWKADVRLQCRVIKHIGLVKGV